MLDDIFDTNEQLNLNPNVKVKKSTYGSKPKVQPIKKNLHSNSNIVESNKGPKGNENKLDSLQEGVNLSRLNFEQSNIESLNEGLNENPNQPLNEGGVEGDSKKPKSKLSIDISFPYGDNVLKMSEVSIIEVELKKYENQVNEIYDILNDIKLKEIDDIEDRLKATSQKMKILEQLPSLLEKLEILRNKDKERKNEINKKNIKGNKDLSLLEMGTLDE